MTGLQRISKSIGSDMFGKKEQTDPHENDIAYKIEPGQEMIHSKYIREGVYDVDGVIIRADNHYEAIKTYEEMQK